MTPRERRDAVRAFGCPTRASKMPGACGPSLPQSSCPIGHLLARVRGTPCSKCYAERLRRAYPGAARRWTQNLRTLRRALEDAQAHYEGDGHCYADSGVSYSDGPADACAHETRAPSGTRVCGRPRAEHAGRRGPCRTCDWIQAGVALLRAEAAHFGDDRVRWQVSGDLQSYHHGRMIFDVCRATPELAHRMPTLEVGTMLALRHQGYEPPANLAVRVSMPRMNTSAPASHPYMTACVWTREHYEAHEPDGFMCRAILEHRPCGPCRACWPGEQAPPPRHVILLQH